MKTDISKINTHLAEKLEQIFDYPMTIVHARQGLGKTAAVEQFLARSNAAVAWHYCEEKDFSAFFGQFCTAVSLIDEEAAGEMEQAFVPDAPEQTAFRCAIILKKRKLIDRSIYVLDCGHGRLSEDIQTFLYHFVSQHVPGTYIVILSCEGGMIPQADSKTDFNDIGEECFRLNEQEIIAAARQEGVPISVEEAIFLMLYTDGWILLVYDLLKELLEKGKQGVFLRIQHITDEWFSAHGIERQQSKSATQVTSDSDKKRILRVLEGLQYEDAEIYLQELLMRAEESDKLFFCICMMQILNTGKGKAKEALGQLCDTAIRFRTDGYKEDAEKTLNMILFVRALLGDVYYREAEELITFYIEKGWRLRSLFIPQLVSFTVMLYKQEYAKVIACRMNAEKNQPVEGIEKLAEEYRCLIDLITAAAYRHMKREEEAWQYFEKGQQKVLENKFYLSAAWIFDYIMDFTVDPRAASFWIEDPQFRSALAAYRRNRQRNLGSSVSARENILTPREQECISLLKEKLTNKEISARLNIIENTVKTNLKSAFRKLGINSRKELQG